MRSSADVTARLATEYDGTPNEKIAERLGIPRVVSYAEIGSTLDAAHDLASEGAPAGTLILADAQTAGRGRAGRSWQSAAGAGVWLTLIERPKDPAALDVLSLRIGLALADALDPLAGDQILLKWPNDLYRRRRKLGGILVEARWRDAAPEWIAIGVGINVRAPLSEPMAIGLASSPSRLAVLHRCVPAIRAAAAREGHLNLAEMTAFERRDMAKGRACVAPADGIVRGIDASGALLVAAGPVRATDSSSVAIASETTAVRSGSLVFREDG